MHFVSFLDILGFTRLVESGELAEVKAKLENALTMVPYGLSLGNRPGMNVIPWQPGLHCSAFSDTYVIWSRDASIVSFFETVIATSLISTTLFASRLGIRGALTCGEATCISHSNQLVGRAVTRAAALEKQQEWFGVIIDPLTLTPERLAILELPLVKPLVVQYEVPLKAGSDIPNPCMAINWRFNLSVEEGIASLFPGSDDPSHQTKRTNTLQFCRWLRDRNLATGAIYGHNGVRLKIPWLSGAHVGSHEPGTAAAIHGDEF